MSPIKLIIADDHQTVREAIGIALGFYNDIELVHSVANGKELINSLHNQKADVVLLDLRMPEMDGFEALQHIRDNHPHIKVLMFSMHDEEHMVTKAKENGASGFLHKSTGMEKLCKAISWVHKGKAYYLPTSEYGTNLTVMPQKSGKPVELTYRQKQIISYTAGGLTHAQIAEKLNLSKRTVDNYKSIILKKLQLKNEKSLITFAYKNGLV